jgi:hypothetical protein
MRDLPKPVPVEVALKKTGTDIVVPNGESLTSVRSNRIRPWNISTTRFVHADRTLEARTGS